MSAYHYTYKDGKEVLTHRLVWEEAHGPIPEGHDIDHINGNRQDNRLENLRPATREQNMWNMKNKNRFGVKGLSWCERRGLWLGQIRAGATRATKAGKDFFEIVCWLHSTRKELHGEFAHC